MDFPIIQKGQITVDGQTYRYEISKLNNNLGCNLIEVWNEKGESGCVPLFKDRTIEYAVRVVREAQKW